MSETIEWAQIQAGDCVACVEGNPFLVTAIEVWPGRDERTTTVRIEYVDRYGANDNLSVMTDDSRLGGDPVLLRRHRTQP